LNYHCQRYPLSHPSCSKSVALQKQGMLPFAECQ
jgi:hypothetical protein